MKHEQLPPGSFASDKRPRTGSSPDSHSPPASPHLSGASRLRAIACKLLCVSRPRSFPMSGLGMAAAMYGPTPTQPTTCVVYVALSRTVVCILLLLAGLLCSIKLHLGPGYK